MSKCLYYLFLFFCFFPFIGINIGTDMQPFALLFAFTIILSQRKIKAIYSNWIVIFELSVILLTAISIFFVPVPAVIKRLYSYVSIIVIYLASYSVGLTVPYHDFEKAAKVFMTIWGVVGAVQLIVNRSFLCFLIPLSRTSSTRGVCSLASEPSFYGYMCFFFFIISLNFNNPKHKIAFATAAVIQTIVFAQSAVALIYFIVFAILYFVIELLNLKFSKILGIILCLTISIILFRIWIKNNSNLRIVRMIQDFFMERENVFDTDDSARSRLNSITVSFSRFGIPGFIGEKQLHSGFGSVFYELGVFSFTLFVPIWKSIYNAYSDKRMAFVVLISITVSMFSGIQLSLPLSAMYFGLCASSKTKGVPLNSLQCSYIPKMEMDNVNEKESHQS